MSASTPTTAADEPAGSPPKDPLTRVADALECIAQSIEMRDRPARATDWSTVIAVRWARGACRPVREIRGATLDSLLGIDLQKQRVLENTRQFVAGHTANNVLLSGARGTGKSSLVKAVLTQFAGQGLRLIEVDRDELSELPEILERVAAAPYRFIVFCDDLAFDARDPGYRVLKAVLDGSVAALPDSVLVYATSNRRHLIPERMDENLPASAEVHPAEAIEERISLSDRFGIWVSFYPFDQDDYLRIAGHWLRALGGNLADDWEREALQWSLERSARNGRAAMQFARDRCGRLAVAPKSNT